MAIKKRIVSSTNDLIESLANELADKPYGDVSNSDELVRTTITLPASVLFKLEDAARDNKRKKSDLKSVSAIIRHCIKRSMNF